jgi:hypothetical protein
MTWVIEQDYSTDSDHEIIILEWKNLERTETETSIKISKIITK